MRRLLTAAAILSAVATVAGAQPAPGREPPNPDANRDGKVTLAEFKAAMAERQARMFARLDANKDGRITQAEVDAASARRDPAEGRGGGFLMRMDANKDGAVTRAEMAAGVEHRFQMADTNKDGWPSKGELLMMRQRMRPADSQ